VMAPPNEDVPPAGVGRGYAALVRRAALAKARSVALQDPERVPSTWLRAGPQGPRGAPHTKGLVLGADTIVVCDGVVLGKPSSRAEARRMLELLSGRWHAVYTGVALVCGERCEVGHQRTEVAFRELLKPEIIRYIAGGEPMDKAGAYAVQGGGAALIRALRGCYTNVVGLPVPLVLRMLRKFEEVGVAEPACLQAGRAAGPKGLALLR